MRHVLSISFELPIMMEPTWRERLVAMQPNRQRRSGYPVCTAHPTSLNKPDSGTQFSFPQCHPPPRYSEHNVYALTSQLSNRQFFCIAIRTRSEITKQLSVDKPKSSTPALPVILSHQKTGILRLGYNSKN